MVNGRLCHHPSRDQTHNATVLGTLGAQLAREFAGVDVGNGHRAFTHQVLAECHGLAEVGGHQRQVFDDETGRMHFVSFNVLGVDAVVADMRVGQGDDLLAVARVCEDFLVAGHGGVEHHFSNCGARGSYGISNKHRAVCKRQNGGGECSL